MREQVLEAEAIEEPVGPATPAEPEVRPLPARRSSAELDAWRGEVRAVAIAAAGGIAAGAVTAAAVSAVRAKTARKPAKRVAKRGRKLRDEIVASRSFLVDVHVLDR